MELELHAYDLINLNYLLKDLLNIVIFGVSAST